ncbi:hypothetical protein C8A01DRAFT_33641 [Parachaetomium inaequale]|uniref:SnoaL-like domain-containing protein n=1 Tax=Parachaetomium inaequale TaxID=2588326 RepID=A0AAN6STS5_9PEZI|nr:hypothetical protein C8A01DRAFT_33641 [Parachaetomium inaequale]
MATPEQSLRQTMETTLRTFLDGYLEASTHEDPSLLSVTLAPTCLRKMLPPSFLKTIGMPTDIALDVKAYENHWKTQLPYAKTVSADVTHLSVDTGNMTGAARDGEEITLDMVWLVSFTEDGAKLTELIEYMDGLEFVKYEPKVRELMAKEKK